MAGDRPEDGSDAPDHERRQGEPAVDGTDEGGSTAGETAEDSTERSTDDGNGDSGTDDATGEGDSASSTTAADADPYDDLDPQDAPLGDLATSVEERESRPPEPVDDDLFTQEEVPEIDPDVVWERLDEEEPVEPASSNGGDVRVVEKDAYCEGCPHFSPPPTVACRHEGTRILELVDLEHFRVEDCPKVRETERLERL